jgi:small subunit ribosomal protein S2
MSETTNSHKDLIKALFNVGAHFGYTRKRRHPSVEPHILGYKNNTAVINLESTVASLAKASTFLKTLGSQNKVVLWVGTKAEAKAAIEKAGLATSMPYVNARWIGGTITNFVEIKKRIKRLVELDEAEKKGGLLKYTKKERGVIAKEKADLERYFRSFAQMEKLPQAVVVIDSEAETMAVKEAQIAKIPVIALASSDCNVDGLNYPIYGNDGNIKSISLVVETLAAAYLDGKNNQEVAQVAPTPTEAATA